MLDQPKPRFRFGPGILITAAFIGPGTVVVASKAGAMHGNALLWVVVFACITTIVFQEMAARIGIVSGQGLGQSIGHVVSLRRFQIAIAALIVLAIVVGNAAYQTGNILGAVSGVSIATGNNDSAALKILFTVLIGLLAAVVIYTDRFQSLQKALTALVILMSCLFLAAAVMSAPSVGSIASGLVPSIPKGSLWLLIAVLGTTVVPYNLFLHASLAARRWKVEEDGIDRATAIRHSRWDTILSVVMGGVVTAAIMISAASAYADSRAAGEVASISGVRDIETQLRPAIGPWSPWLFGVGLFAAGLTSSITAPLAAAYAAAGCFGWPDNPVDFRLRIVAAVIIVAGVASALIWNGSPQQAIALAQVANGLLLPVLAGFILAIANRRKLMQQHTNSVAFNVLAFAMIVIVILLAVRQLKSGLGL